MGFSFQSLVVLNIDSALEDPQLQQRHPSGDDDADVEAYDCRAEAYNETRNADNMPDVTNSRFQRLSFALALIASGIFIILMMAFAGAHGKAIRMRGSSYYNHTDTWGSVVFDSEPEAESSAVISAQEKAQIEIDVDSSAVDFGTSSPAISNGVSEIRQKQTEMTAMISTLQPTKIPSLSPTRRPTSPPSSHTCEDDTTYVSPLGMSCANHIRIDCSKFDDVGAMSSEQVQELQQRCPKSCKVPECSDPDTDSPTYPSDAFSDA